ncbi:hypothetical protein P154DRAFT_619927 [Amniculicola lignicola CBS 123094]|uniref:Uncharacterized protein n=1 Tax=Amniculicola lignicola CBS 123094 TaxID=1392246 RepID=A0A6A5WIC6_9PLEO|nr:hypothetical protein P154DRAFT_619927 [Amniculicola lignicola CBS 123094]
MATTFPPHQPSPLARTAPPLKSDNGCLDTIHASNSSSSVNTGKLWDEYERRAVEAAKRREATCPRSPLQVKSSQRFSSGTVLDIIKSYDPHSSPRVPSSTTASPRFEFGFPGSASSRRAAAATSSTTVATCKTCERPIDSASGICEKCIRIIGISPKFSPATPPITPTRRSLQSQDIPIRLSSLRPPPPPTDAKKPSQRASRSRKSSLTDPNEPFLRLQISRKPVARTHPSSPTTPPSTSYCHSSSCPRPSSLVNITTHPSVAPYNGHKSATPSEYSTLYPYISSSTTASPPSVCRASYNLQNTTSAWDDWDSDEEEKAGLVGYWRGRKWRGSRGSLSAVSGRDSASKDEGAMSSEEGRDTRDAKREKKRRGFVRVISCGCNEDE